MLQSSIIIKTIGLTKYFLCEKPGTTFCFTILRKGDNPSISMP